MYSRVGWWDKRNASSVYRRVQGVLTEYLALCARRFLSELRARALVARGATPFSKRVVTRPP